MKLWSLGDGELSQLASLKGHKRAVWALAFSPIDKALASSSGDMTIKVCTPSHRGRRRGRGGEDVGYAYELKLG